MGRVERRGFLLRCGAMLVSRDWLMARVLIVSNRLPVTVRPRRGGREDVWSLGAALVAEAPLSRGTS